MIEIWTGGQTGVDQGALFAAAGAGLTTGGWMPAGYLTESGPNPDLAAHYDLRPLEPDWGELSIADQYRERTRRNVEEVDAVLILATNMQSPGTKLTSRLANEYHRQTLRLGILLHIKEDSPQWIQDSIAVAMFVDWSRAQAVKRIMVAGTRESKAPGIGQWVERFLMPIFTDLAETEKEG